MSYNYANDIKSRVSVRDACERYGIAVTSAGFAVCPFHSEKTGSLKVDYRGDGYHCFGCGAHGDVIDFVGGLFNLGFRDAVKKINTDFCLGLPIGEKLSDDEEARLEAISREIRRLSKQRAFERDKLFNKYLDALERWISLDRLMRNHKPKSPDNIPFLYSYACGRIEQAKFELQCAECALFEFEKHDRERRQNAVTTNSNLHG